MFQAAGQMWSAYKLVIDFREKIMQKKITAILCAIASLLIFTNCAQILNTNNSDINKIKSVLGIKTEDSDSDSDDDEISMGTLEVYETSLNNGKYTYYYSNFTNLTLQNGKTYAYTFPVQENYVYYIVVSEYDSSSSSYNSKISNIQMEFFNSSKTSLFSATGSTNFPCIKNDTYTLKLKISDETSETQIGVQILRKYAYTSYYYGEYETSLSVDNSSYYNYKFYCEEGTLYSVYFSPSSSTISFEIWNTDSSFEFYKSSSGTYNFLSKESGYAIISFYNSSSYSSSLSFEIYKNTNPSSLQVDNDDSSYPSITPYFSSTSAAEYYKVNVQKGQKYYIHYLDYYSDTNSIISSSKADGYLQVFNSKGKAITLYNKDDNSSIGTSNDDYEYVYFTASESGTYWVKIEPKTSSSSGYIGISIYTESN